jgi:hypothetical protein
MKRIAVTCLLVLSGFCSFSIDGHAEFTWQSLNSPFDEKWRKAGSSLFTGVARIYDGLAAFEVRNNGQAKEYMGVAIKSLTDAASTYADVEKSMTAPRRINLSQLPKDTKDRISDVFRAYGTPLPSDERQAAGMAVAEVKLLLDTLKTKTTISTLQDAQQLQMAVGRLLNLGTDVAVLLQGEH